MIMTGVHYETEENLEAKVSKIVNDTNILDHAIDYSFISHVHRNKQKQQKEGDTRPPLPHP